MWRERQDCHRFAGDPSDDGIGLSSLKEKLSGFDRQTEALAKTHPTCKRLISLPGVELLTSTVLLALVGDSTPSETAVI